MYTELKKVTGKYSSFLYLLFVGKQKEVSILNSFSLVKIITINENNMFLGKVLHWKCFDNNKHNLIEAKSSSRFVFPFVHSGNTIH